MKQMFLITQRIDAVLNAKLTAISVVARQLFDPALLS